jgi:hypothetical protein
MFVTMGTSLFHSASWETDKVRSVRYYEEWTTPACLDAPEARKRTPHAQNIQGWLETALRAEKPEVWGERLAQEFLDGEPGRKSLKRYSAELTTLFKIQEKELISPAELLASYETIYLVCDEEGRGQEVNLPHVAAAHTAHALNRLAGQGRALVQPVPGLSSTDPGILLGDNTGLGRLVRLILADLDDAEQVDLVISGGYKIYGIYLAKLVDLEKRAVRLLYLHEDGDLLVQVPGELPDPAAAARLSEEEKNRRVRELRGFIGIT